MLEKAAWREVESEVYVPRRRFAVAAAVVFALAPTAFGVSIQHLTPPGILHWLAWSIAVSVTVVGIFVVVSSFGNLRSPSRVRHAAPEVLPGVPDEPVVFEGSVVESGRTHQLIEDFAGWEFRPARRSFTERLSFLFFFGIPFLAMFSLIGSMIVHQQVNAAGWNDSILVGTSVALLIGVPVLLVTARGIRTADRRLARLMIPRNGDSVVLEMAELSASDKADPTSGLEPFLDEESQRMRRTIPRELLRAVQLCPWKLVRRSMDEMSVTWAVQGLLVVEGSAVGGYDRFPFLLNNDLIGTAHLVQQLAETLQVPYLFHADEKGWQAESGLAASRPRLKLGSM